MFADGDAQYAGIAANTKLLKYSVILIYGYFMLLFYEITLTHVPKV